MLPRRRRLYRAATLVGYRTRAAQQRPSTGRHEQLTHTGEHSGASQPRRDEKENLCHGVLRWAGASAVDTNGPRRAARTPQSRLADIWDTEFGECPG